MTSAEFWALLMLATAVSFTPGPNTTLSTAIAANRGLRPALRFVLAVPVGWSMLLVLGTLPFCALGLLIGSLARARSAAGWVNLIYLPMGALSGLWFPLFLMPTVLQKLAYALPAYHLGQLSLAASGQIEVVVWRHVAMLLLFTLVFASLAARALQRSVK